MALEIDDVSIRVIGTGYRGIQFYDDTRVLQAEIYLQSDGDLNIGADDGDGGVGGGIDAHALDGSAHVGTLSNAQAPQFVLLSGNRDMTGDLLFGDDHGVKFRDSDLAIYSSTDGQLDLTADAEIELTAPTIALQGNVDVSSGLDVSGNITVTGTVDGVDVANHATRHESGGADAVGHDSLSGFVADEHVAHSMVSISAGGILSGGGTIAVNRTISLNHSDVDHDQTTNFVADEHVAHSTVTLTAGDGLKGGGTIADNRTFSVDVSDFAISGNRLGDDGSENIYVYGLRQSDNGGDALVADAAGDLTAYGGITFNAAETIDTSAGNLTLAPAGDLILNPTGNDVLPTNNYDISLGSLSKKYLTLHAAELWVGTLVAQDTMATIGGRVLVGPTTELIADAASGDTSIDVKHNNLSNGDRVVMEANGKLEWMAITSAASGITGGYRYSVTRNLDGTGANQWYAGDAVFNTGAAGDGFIDLYSIAGVTAGATAGPTIAGNVRNSDTYDDYTECWAIGNLDGLYGYGTTTYGVGLGKYSAAAYLTIDPANGIRFFSSDDTQRAQLTSTTWTLGDTSNEHVNITTSAVQIKDGASVLAEYTSTIKMWDKGGTQRVQLNNDGSGWLVSSGVLSWDTSGNISMTGSITISGGSGISNLSDAGALATENNLDGVPDGSTYGRVDSTILASGLIQVGSGTKDNDLDGWHISASEIVGQSSGDDQVVLGTGGTVSAGGGLIVLDGDGLQLQLSTSYNYNVFNMWDGSSSLVRWFRSDGTAEPEGVVAWIGPGNSGDLTFEVQNTPSGLNLGGGRFIIGARTGASTFDTYLEVDTLGNVTVGEGAWRFGQTALDLDFTGADYDTKTECQAVGLRFSDSDTPFPSNLARTISGSWSHQSGYGWRPASTNNGEGPAILIPLMRPGNWQLTISVRCQEGGNEGAYVYLGGLDVTQCVGFYGKWRLGRYVIDGNSFRLFGAFSNDGDDTYTNQIAYGTAISATGTYEAKIRSQNGIISVYDDQDDSWSHIDSRYGVGWSFTPSILFIQVQKWSGYQLYTFEITDVTLEYLV